MKRQEFDEHVEVNSHFELTCGKYAVRAFIYVQATAFASTDEDIEQAKQQAKERLWRHLQPDQELKLFVWTQFRPDYSSGLAVAIAHTMEEAIERIKEEKDIGDDAWGPVQVFPIDQTRVFAVCGGG